MDSLKLLSFNELLLKFAPLSKGKPGKFLWHTIHTVFMLSQYLASFLFLLPALEQMLNFNFLILYLNFNYSPFLVMNVQIPSILIPQKETAKLKTSFM